jgi:glutathione S-transferase
MLELTASVLVMRTAPATCVGAASIVERADSSATSIHARFAQLEKVLGNGPYFDGDFSLVDAVFGPVFRYFEVFDRIGDFGCLDGLPKVLAWRHALTARPSVRQAAHPRYHELLREFLLRRNSALAGRMRGEVVAA